MGRWNYTLRFGKNLRDAIDAGDVEAVVKCLIACYRELLIKLSDEDKEWWQFDIEESIEILMLYVIDPDDEDNVDYYLEEFYNICDSVGAWVAM